MPYAYYPVFAGVAAMIGALVGWFIGTKRPPWKDMM